MKYFIAILSVSLLLGCSEKPGYSTRINIEKDAGINKSDIYLITSVFKSRTFETSMKKEEGAWKIESYKIMLESNKFNAIKHRYIGVAIESWCELKQNAPCRIEVRILNAWEGRKPVVKAEIDKITDSIIENLSKKTSASQLKVQRKYASPM